jgi:hypothetical protein
MLRLMLGHHPRVAFAGECDFIVDAITPEGRFMKRRAYLEFLSLDRVFHNRNLNIPQGVAFPRIAHDFLDQVARTKPAPAAVGMTIHRHFDRLLWLWPDARYIHLVRDGRDVALSTIPMGWAGNMYRGIRAWAEVEELWRRMAERLPADRQITVTYEDLAADPEYELRRICDFLGVDYDPAMLRYDRESTYGPPHGDSIGKWKHADPKDLSAAEFVAARGLINNGYQLAGTITAPSILRRIALRVQDRWAIASYRRRLFGNRLWFDGLWTTRFGTREEKARLIHRQNAIVERALK